MCATIGPLRHGPCRLLPLRRCRAHDRVPHITPNSPEPFPNTPDPQRGRALASGESPPQNQAAPTRAAPATQPELAIKSQASI
jgi:hypothetical protein